jgi:hypothetical protein
MLHCANVFDAAHQSGDIEGQRVLVRATRSKSEAIRRGGVYLLRVRELLY